MTLTLKRFAKSAEVFSWNGLALVTDSIAAPDSMR